MSECVEGYTPTFKGPVTAEAWGRVAPLVKATVTQLAVSDVTLCRQYLTWMTRLTVWCDREGLDLTVEVVLHPATVERFVAMLPAGTATSTVRSKLRRLTDVCLAGAPEVAAVPIGRRDPRPPYTPAEVGLLFADARARKPYQRDCLLAGLCLGLGAGTGRGEMSAVTGTHVTRRNGLLVVAVPGDRARTVAVRYEFAVELEQLAAAVGERLLVSPQNRGGKNVAKSLSSWMRGTDTTPAFDVDRLRATWLLHHLAAGTPMRVLADAAGTTTAVTLMALVAYLPAPDAAAADRMLAGVTS